MHEHARDHGVERAAHRAPGHLALLPLHALLPFAWPQRLALCAESGIAVQPYRLEPARPGAQGTPAQDERIWLDVAGAVRGYTPALPDAGEPAWSHEPFAGEVLCVLVVGERAVGALVCGSGAAWAFGRHDGSLPRAELDPGACSVAEAAARALGAHAAEVALVRAGGALLGARPGPDWSRFEAALGPCVPRALWEHALTLESR